jgi:molybdopterin synthase catalytic subunit
MQTDIRFFDAPLPPSSPWPPEIGGAVGAWAEFWGCVRRDEQGRAIAGLRYEIYETMARRQLESHLAELAKKFPLLAARVWHRQGLVPVGEAAVYVAIGTPHRREAFAALAELMDRLKKDVPIWKVEVVPA